MNAKTRFSLVLFVTFIIQPLLCFGQWGMISFRGGGEINPTILATSDGGCIVVSSGKAIASADNNIWVLKLNASGEIIWQMEYDAGEEEFGFDVKETEDPGYIVVGTIRLPNTNQSDILILKLNATGQILWQKRLSGFISEGGVSVLQTKDGGYIVEGMIDRNGDQTNVDIILVKLTAQGNISWQKAYGGEKWEWWCNSFNPLIQTADDGYAIVANIKSFGSGANDIWVLKLDATGQIIWQKAYGTSYDEQVESISQTADGGYVVVGKCSFNARDMAWLLKLTANGTLVWQKAYEGSDPCGHEGTSVWEVSGGELILGGYQSNCTYPSPGERNGWLIRLDSVGNPIWMKSYGGSGSMERHTVFRPVPDGGFLMAGETEYPNLSASGIMVLRLDDRGEIPRCNVIHNDQPVSFNTSAEAVTTPVVPQSSNLVSSDANLVARDVLYDSTKLCVPLPRPKAVPWLPLLMDD